MTYDAKINLYEVCKMSTSITILITYLVQIKAFLYDQYDQK
jgi:hypothetical protein